MHTLRRRRLHHRRIHPNRLAGLWRRRLNWRLLHYRPAIIDYVVAHELAHLRAMDHSPRFWGTVATVVPDYPVLRHALREQPAPLWE